MAARIWHGVSNKDAHSGYTAIAILGLDEELTLGHNLILNQGWSN
ncbi:MAG: hypothetical protein IRD7MM_03620 [Candidatus Midichloria mitochondrii]|nr:hypothetical protein [Candidatus Midichloria mitochondrii]